MSSQQLQQSCLLFRCSFGAGAGRIIMWYCLICHQGQPEAEDGAEAQTSVPDVGCLFLPEDGDVPVDTGFGVSP
jgi:hypothetical protein